MTAIPILMYHNIGRPPEGARLRSLYVRRGAFARQMRLLRMLGYQGLSMQQAMPYLRGERVGRVAAITFDDGYIDTLESALPVLKHHGFSATCYIVSGRMGSYNDWDAQSLGVRKPLMSAAQIRAWKAEGMEVGAEILHLQLVALCKLQALVDGPDLDQGAPGLCWQALAHESFHLFANGLQILPRCAPGR